jgi:hypothetical protein
MDITVEVMLPPRGATDYAESANPRYRALMPVHVYVPMKVVDTVGMPRTGYVHVTDVPLRPAWAAFTSEEIERRINQRLCRNVLDQDGNVIERSEWAGDVTVIPSQARNRLRTERQITVTWTAFKNVMRNFIESGRQLSDEDFD